MIIIKDGQVSDNTWHHIGDGSAADARDNVSVPFQRWLAEMPDWQNRAGKTGIRLTSADTLETLEALTGHLQGIDLIELEFPGFGDGRPFSQARLLRDKLGYQGEIRAVGNFLPDQIFFLTRVGVNAFALNNPEHVPLALSCLDDFTVRYQMSSC